MKHSLLDYLVCPESRTRLELEIFRLDGEEIMEGVLRSPLGKTYPITGGIPRFVSSEAYTSSFGYEWNRHSRIYFDGKDKYRIYSTHSQLARKVDLSAEKVRDAVVLDVGCGTGAKGAAIAEWGAREVLCVDLSSAVIAAFSNTRHLANVHVIQADLFSLPFAHEQFNFIYSVGVLHHSSDTRNAFLSLVPYLKDSGVIAIWVYHDGGGMQQRLSDRIRTITKRMSPKVLYRFCYLAVPAYYLYKIPVLGKLLFHFLPPISKEPYWEDRVLDTFDWYSPFYQWKHTYPEVHRWFKEAKLADIHLLDVPVSAWGKKVGKPATP
jgi:SAM-dependent methyltransferase